jgi:hypothetical protein
MRGFFFDWVLARRSDVLVSHLKAIWASWGGLAGLLQRAVRITRRSRAPSP